MIDGDTLDLGGERIRLFGIDAPERGPVRCTRVNTDRYARTVARCKAGRVDVNREMVRRDLVSGNIAHNRLGNIVPNGKMQSLHQETLQNKLEAIMGYNDDHIRRQEEERRRREADDRRRQEQDRQRRDDENRRRQEQDRQRQEQENRRRQDQDRQRQDEENRRRQEQDRQRQEQENRSRENARSEDQKRHALKIENDRIASRKAAHNEAAGYKREVANLDSEKKNGLKQTFVFQVETPRLNNALTFNTSKARPVAFLVE